MGKYDIFKMTGVGIEKTGKLIPCFCAKIINMKILDKPVSKKDLLKNSEAVFDERMIKGVVDINKGLLAIDAQLHADLEQLFLENNSLQESLWGINLYPIEVVQRWITE